MAVIAIIMSFDTGHSWYKLDQIQSNNLLVCPVTSVQNVCLQSHDIIN